MQLMMCDAQNYLAEETGRESRQTSKLETTEL